MDYFKYFEKIKNELLASMENQDDIQGASNFKIRELEKHLNRKLPIAVIAYLKVLGMYERKASIDMLYYDILIYLDEKYLSECVDDEDINVDIPSNALFIGRYECSQFWFVNCVGDDDPEVFEISFEYSREDGPNPLGVKFTEFTSNYLLTGCVVNK